MAKARSASRPGCRNPVPSLCPCTAHFTEGRRIFLLLPLYNPGRVSSPARRSASGSGHGGVGQHLRGGQDAGRAVAAGPADRVALPDRLCGAAARAVAARLGPEAPACGRSPGPPSGRLLLEGGIVARRPDPGRVADRGLRHPDHRHADHQRQPGRLLHGPERGARAAVAGDRAAAQDAAAPDSGAAAGGGGWPCCRGRAARWWWGTPGPWAAR